MRSNYLINNFSVSVPEKEINILDQESYKEEIEYKSKYQLFTECDLLNLY